MLKVKTLFKELFRSNGGALLLQAGGKLSDIRVAYQTYGKMNTDGSNAILLCHALTGNAHAAGFLDSEEHDSYSRYDLLGAYSAISKGRAGWWDGLVGPGCAFDTDKYFVVCSNILGSCYGTTGPASIDPATGKNRGRDFPVITVRDMVRLEHELILSLGIKSIHSVAGGSLGGMQALEWAVLYPDMVRSIIPIASAVKNSAWGIALNQAGKSAIIMDPGFLDGNYSERPFKGLEIARQMAMISYRSQESYEKKFGRERTSPYGNYFDISNKFQIQNYLEYQGRKLALRYDPNCYLRISDATDLFDLSEGRGDIESVLSSIKARSLFIGISSDVLYPAAEIRKSAAMVPGSAYAEIDSIFGHDAFLIEFGQLERMIKSFL